MVWVLEDSDIEALQRGDMIQLETEDGKTYGLIINKFLENEEEEKQ